MTPYSAKDLETIRTQYAPAGTVCRVVTVRHLHGDKYAKLQTDFFKTREEGIDFANQDGGAEVRMPGWEGDIAFSADGKLVRMFTYFGA